MEMPPNPEWVEEMRARIIERTTKRYEVPPFLFSANERKAQENAVEPWVIETILEASGGVLVKIAFCLRKKGEREVLRALEESDLRRSTVERRLGE